MVNIQQILNSLNVNPAMQNKVMQAWQAASEMSAGVHTKEQALGVLRNNGVDGGAMQKISKYINHPLAVVAAKMAGVNIVKFREDFNSLADLLGSNSPQVPITSNAQAPTSGNTRITPISTSGNDPLAKYKNGLQQL